MPYKNVLEVCRISSGFCIKIHSTTFETSLLQQNKHDMYCIIDIVKKFVRIPAIMRVTLVYIKAAKETIIVGCLYFMVKSMPSQSSMIVFNVDLEITI